MKKVLIVALVLAICFGLIAVVGCGGDTATAKTYMEEGDALSTQMRAFTSESALDVTALLADLGIQLSETGTVQKKTVTDAAIKQIDSIILKGTKAKAAYNKMDDLKGVQPYKDYANARVSAINSTIVVLKAVKSLLKEIGDPANKASISSTISEWAKANLGATVDAVKAFTSWRDADKIKKENKLGPEEKVVKETTPTSTPN